MNPSSNGNGRAANGRFSAGWKGGPGGNPFAAAAQKLRARLYEALTSDDVAAAVGVLRDVMKAGTNVERIAAARELLNRAVGKAEQYVHTETADADTIDVRFLSNEELMAIAATSEKVAERAKCAQCGIGSPCSEHQ